MQYKKESPESIIAMFNTIARSYDRTNAIVSLNLHRHWNSQLISHVMKNICPKEYLDLCCGTGEIALTYLKQPTVQACNATLLDFCEGMLNCAKQKVKNSNLDKKHQLTYLQADAQVIPLKDQSIDCTTIAYGIRNVKDPQRCINDVYRVLRAGGKFGILELTQPEQPFFRFTHKIYLRTVLPFLGYLFSPSKEAYDYLCNSIQTFKKPTELAVLLKNAGFSNIQIVPLTFGTATILIAEKKI